MRGKRTRCIGFVYNMIGCIESSPLDAMCIFVFLGPFHVMQWIGDKWQKTIVVNCRYLKSGPGNLDRDIERKFSYALSREDVENAILGGPWFQSTPVIQPTFPTGCGFLNRGRHHTEIGTWVAPEFSFWFWLVVCVLILWMIIIPKRGSCGCKCNASQGRYHLRTK